MALGFLHQRSNWAPLSSVVEPADLRFAGVRGGRRQACRGGQLRIDYVGIILIAVGFSYLEVVLDRGERDDWLGSHLITTLLVLALVRIAVAIWCEWSHHNPVVELKLMRDRSFSIACLYYFVFSFGLFGSTILIPEILETLFGY